MAIEQYPGIPAGSPAEEIRKGLAGVLRGIDRAVGAEVAPGHREALTQAMAALAGGQDALDLAAARLAARMRETGALAGTDHSTVTGLLRDNGRSLAQAKDIVRVAEHMDDYGDSVRSAEAGEIGFAHLAKIVAECENATDKRPVDEYPDEDEFRAKAEPIMLQAAKSGADKSTLGKIGRTLVCRISPKTHEEENRRAYEERRLRRLRNPFGFTLDVQGDIASEHILVAALECHLMPPSEGDERTTGERWFDALMQLCENRLIAEGVPVPVPEEGSDAAKALAAPRPCSCGGKGAGRPLVNVTVPLATLQGEEGSEPAVSDRDRVLPGSVARAFATDCVLQRIVTDPVTGKVLDVGTARRLFPDKVRHALAARTTVCQWEEGCTTPVRWCEADHRTEWWEGGSTTVENGQMLCGRHNREKHRRRAEAHYLAADRRHRPRRGGGTRREHGEGEAGPDPPDPPGHR
ncbi:HNH endonuclease signature motif containing protein [Nocardiopsis sp. RSe5-2]|uniref:HNH endonuclease signature motif containing protein n=1 Tax=Nocardiopsis endophytica TaxID=3018445 RepID=A0ABT4U3D0_9ACTN|nr:HNH endonuclease signature motif containing protein [Nocardiopsis endophytica]MDA2811454.1 HNH endonuclease signature motif containing protein [Nocardiopsis endophytica]